MATPDDMTETEATAVEDGNKEREGEAGTGTETTEGTGETGKTKTPTGKEARTKGAEAKKGECAPYSQGSSLKS